MKLDKLNLINSIKNKMSSSLEPQSTAIMHVDVVGSTRFVRDDMVLAHQRIQDLYSRMQHIVRIHQGEIYELRGDAAVIGFNNSDNALLAALMLQQTNSLLNSTRLGLIEPRLRLGISKGDVLIANKTVTGEAVIIAQRLEQLANAGEVLIDENTRQSLSNQLEFRIKFRTSKVLKGFSVPTRVYSILDSNRDSGIDVDKHFSEFSHKQTGRLALT